MLTPAQLVGNIGDARAAPRFRSLNEIWSLGLPIQPRVIVNWPGCVQVMDQTTPGYGFWQQLKWPTGLNDGYYANQGSGDCIVYGLGEALSTRGRGDEALPKLTAVFGCNANGVNAPVEGLYTLNLQETGFIPTWGASKAAETSALNAVVNWFRNNQHNARAGLNYITGDFVDFAGDCCTPSFPLAALAVGLNKPTVSDPYAAGPELAVTLDVVEPGTGALLRYTPNTVASGPVRVTATCSTSKGAGPVAVSAETESSPSASTTLKIDITQSTVGVPLVCRDNTGRLARLVVGPLAIQPPTPAAVTAAPWIIGPAAAQTILNYDAANRRWTGVDGAAVRVASSPDGQPWVINQAGAIWRRTRGPTGYADGTWQPVPGGRSARDIAVGADGSVWIIDTTPGAAGQGYGIERLMNAAVGAWKAMLGPEAVAIAVGPDGQPWVINASGEIWQGLKGGTTNSYIDGSFNQVSGAARAIGVGAEGSVWVVGSDGVGSGIFKYAGTQWQQIGGAGKRIAVDAGGDPWVVNELGEVWFYQVGPGAWQQWSAAGTASDVSVGGGAGGPPPAGPPALT